MEEIDWQRIGREARKARHRLGWTQDDLAAWALVSKYTISRLENGAAVALGTLFKLGLALGMDFQSLLRAEYHEPDS